LYLSSYAALWRLFVILACRFEYGVRLLGWGAMFDAPVQ
jgi:hypothetical protein